MPSARAGAVEESRVHRNNAASRRAVLATTLSLVFVPVAPALAEGAATDLDNVVVTATRTAQTQDQALAAVSVIEREEIERLQPASLPDLLRGRAGISLANNGGPGKSTSLFLRGTESDHVLVLVDGVKIGSATSGGAALQDIPVEQIERIEIVRGPFSSLYGSEAIGGVVEVFTRRPQGPFEPNARIAAGSDDTWRVAAGVGGRSAGALAGGRGGWYALQAAHESTAGIDAYRGTRNADPDRDGYRNSSLTAQGGYRFDERWDGDLRVFQAEGENEYDGGPASESEFTERVVGARLRYAPGARATFTLSAGTSADLSENYFDGVFNSRFDTRRELGGVQADLGLGTGLLTLGFDWQRDEVESSEAYARDRRINRGLFGQWQQDFGAQSLQASVRRDDDGQFGGETTGSVLWGWDFARALRLTASYGTGFKAPTFNELYYPGYGNPDLGPETSRSVELGLRGEPAWGQWSLNAFQTRIDDMIAYDADLGQFGGPNNIDRARIRGLEAVVDTLVAGWDLRGSATWLDPENDAGSAGKVLPRRARQSARIDLDRRFGAFSGGASLTAAGERYDNLANTRRMGGYGLFDLRLGYALAEAWDLRLSVENVFDKSYETAMFYNQPGRSWLLSLRWHPAR
ncbi:TonB-dependent vitamin B12 receptor [Marilutibacter spongiae]|uniref:TonB-dependent vitamin B12 receptor n=1 Tax=Marilutibacter spongiae TaxID=2025720 RepID=A0A7W3TIU9_9GAMM|nr:TonB-dependent vitamin B12 receptor [Lysobacter spongiae]MBB1059150.1 TonB-dependent vitamin B12 receptor [Lysobacter spongiae]